MKLGDSPAPPNILFIITDQQRAFRHWPEGWGEENLPSFQRLQEHGLTFRNSFTNTSMCSPSRATFWTSTFPAENGVTSTGGVLDPARNLTLGDVLGKAGYQIVYCGKWHLGGNTPNPTVTPPDAGFGTSWDSPDAGIGLSAGSWQGAGTYNNDERFLGTVTGDQEKPPGTGKGPSLLEFLQSYDGKTPFFAVASFVNPHDIGVAPFQLDNAGYDPAQWKDLPIHVPETWNEDLSTKPGVQSWFQKKSPGFDVPSWTEAQRKSYARFYAYLQMLVDQDIQILLDALDKAGVTDNTIIFRFSDHGEMGLSHGLVEKAFNAYEETIHVPLIVSNPQLFPEGRRTEALAGLIDLLPTVASIVGVLDQYPGKFRGVDLTPLFSEPGCDVQDSVHFTFNDTGLGTPAGLPWQIRALREKDWLYAAYYFVDDQNAAVFEYELYDLRNDPDETKNLANPKYATPESLAELDRLNRKLIEVMYKNGTMPELPPPGWPQKPQIGE